MVRVNSVGEDSPSKNENPPAATSGLSENSHFARIELTSEQFTTAVYRFLQCCDIVETTKNIIKKFDDGTLKRDELSVDERKRFSVLVASGFEIYKAGFRHSVRSTFKEISGVDFDDFGEDLSALAIAIGEPIGPVLP